MENSGKIIGINLLLFILYTLLIHAGDNGDAALAGAIIAYIHAGGIFVVGLFMAIFSNDPNRSRGMSLILAGLLIAIIGFSVCLGTLSLNIH
ncbi:MULTISPECIES: hypothetical protein [unclassified Aureispira]|uniref:hypothetical protein n=1 Tax=unclassified Aureispira TaxID=2649989 RepID=UPI0006961D91|nr:MULTISPECIES: hypothetical protein [unclassified Aureispira]WMX16682.1 hypothetical protein QP953_09910 [Aureispira sp. CCB-E]